MAAIPGLIHLDEVPWEPFGGQTKEVFRKSLSARALPPGFRAVLTMVKPGGEFPEHVDPYSHIFYVLEGEGKAWFDGQTVPLRKGISLTIAAGQRHGYRNATRADLFFITLNIPEGREGR